MNQQGLQVRHLLLGGPRGGRINDGRFEERFHVHIILADTLVDMHQHTRLGYVLFHPSKPGLLGVLDSECTKLAIMGMQLLWKRRHEMVDVGEVRVYESAAHALSANDEEEVFDDAGDVSVDIVVGVRDCASGVGLGSVNERRKVRGECITGAIVHGTHSGIGEDGGCWGRGDLNHVLLSAPHANRPRMLLAMHQIQHSR